MATERNSLKVNRIYFVESDEMYFVTPDCFGGYWYETLEEAQEEHGDMTPIHIPDLED
jgi:hypothetical protein